MFKDKLIEYINIKRAKYFLPGFKVIVHTIHQNTIHIEQDCFYQVIF